MLNMPTVTVLDMAFSILGHKGYFITKDRKIFKRRSSLHSCNNKSLNLDLISFTLIKKLQSSYIKGRVTIFKSWYFHFFSLKQTNLVF